MATVIFYNFILLSSTFFVWMSEKGKGNLERYFFLSIAFLLVFLPAALRYDIGTDYVNYLDIYETGSYKSYQFKEPAFYFINWFLNSIDAHSQWLFFTFSFIFTAVAFKAYPRRNAWLLHFLFFSMLWFFSFNGIRQAIALSWCMLALSHFFDKRYGWFIVLTLIGSTFHQSVLLITVFGLVALIPINHHIKIRIAPLSFIGFLVFTSISINVVIAYIEPLLSTIGLTKYSYYFGGRHFIEREHGSGLGALIKIIFSIYILLNTKSLLRVNENYWLLVVLVFIYAVGVILANQIIIFGRMADTFVLAPIISAYLLLLLPNHKQVHRFILILFLLFMILTFNKLSLGEATSYSDPKLNPYTTIFEDR